MTEQPTVEESAYRLYGTEPRAFVAARESEAKRLREASHPGVAKDVHALRRPSVAAALVDAVVRQQPDLVDEVGAVGRRLRAATGDADAGPADLRAVDDDRRSTVQRCVEAAAEVARSWASPASPASLREVEQTFWAAAVDPAALAAVRAGCLVRTLSPSGFGTVDLAGASAVTVVVPDGGPPPSRSGRRAKTSPRPPAARPPGRDELALRRAREALRVAEQGLHQAEAEAAAAVERGAAAAQRTADVEAGLAELRRRLTAAEADLRTATAEKRRTTSEKQDAERRRREASRAVDRARRHLDDLRA